MTTQTPLALMERLMVGLTALEDTLVAGHPKARSVLEQGTYPAFVLTFAPDVRLLTYDADMIKHPWPYNASAHTQVAALRQIAPLLTTAALLTPLFSWLGASIGLAQAQLTMRIYPNSPPTFSVVVGTVSMVEHHTIPAVLTAMADRLLLAGPLLVDTRHSAWTVEDKTVYADTPEGALAAYAAHSPRGVVADFLNGSIHRIAIAQQVDSIGTLAAYKNRLQTARAAG